MTYVYLNIIKEIKRTGDTQRNLSRILGVSELTFRKKLAGITQWTIDEIDKLCNHFDMDYYELFKKD